MNKRNLLFIGAIASFMVLNSSAVTVDRRKDSDHYTHRNDGQKAKKYLEKLNEKNKYKTLEFVTIKEKNGSITTLDVTPEKAILEISYALDREKENKKQKKMQEKLSKMSPKKREKYIAKRFGQ